ncbi:MAG: nucleotidyl transferase AbiEii/AbiGii toxin family protein [Candidatus Gribaldobacteria bacterium]|nr:nucleotidyl transferase AbiEii/AbiGii toxin family protein [Candidatus Gribaldobacteria bacterium]
MLNLEKQNALHKAQLYRLLISLLDNKKISPNIFFKGGTCTTMLGFLDRFSVDLDFDLKNSANKSELRKEFHLIFKNLGLVVKDESKNALQFFLKYQAPASQRNTLRLEILDNPFLSIDYQVQYLKEIDRTAICQTKESIFANKLVALADRYKKRKTIAGRDVYDIHYFFSQGYNYKPEIIKERTGKTALAYLKELKVFMEDKMSQTVINQDIGFLLSDKKFKILSKTLKIETLVMIEDEIQNLASQLD